MKANLPERCVVDGEIIVPQGDRLHFESLLAADPSRRVAGQPARRADTGVLRRLRPARARRRVAAGRAVRRTPGAAPDGARRRPRARLRHRGITQDPGDRAALVRHLRGRGSGRRRRQGPGPAVRPGPAADDQGQARAHRRLRGRRVPLAQERPDRRLPAARPVQRRRRPAAHRGRGLLPDGAAGGAGRGAGALPGERRSRGIRGRTGRTRRSTRTAPSTACRARSAAGTRARTCSWVPLRPELVVEIKYDQLEGRRLRHTGHFLRWRPDRDAAELHVRPARTCRCATTWARCWPASVPRSGVIVCSRAPRLLRS